MRGIFQYLISFAGAILFSIIVVSSVAFIASTDRYDFIWTVWFIGILLLFYGCIASLIWELVFHFIHLKTLWRGGVLYFFIGAICGVIAISIVHVNIGETDITGWIGSMIVMGIAAFIFYAIRRKTY